MRVLFFFLFQSITGKELIACKTAEQSFLSILNVVGGPNEKRRAKQFLNTVTILDDLTEDEEKSLWSLLGCERLRLAKKIQNRTYKIFSFGMYHKAITVTANKGAIEAAKMQVTHLNIILFINCFNELNISVQGLSIPAIVHEARALTEQKQSTACKIEQ